MFLHHLVNKLCMTIVAVCVRQEVLMVDQTASALFSPNCCVPDRHSSECTVAVESPSNCDYALCTNHSVMNG